MIEVTLETSSMVFFSQRHSLRLIRSVFPLNNGIDKIDEKMEEIEDDKIVLMDEDEPEEEEEEE